MSDAAAPDPAQERRYEEQRPEDYRQRYARDNDRLLYSSAFRRLDGVTQVVSVDETQLFHNRLTHTLKVAQISLRMAERLLSLQDVGVEQFGGLSPTAAEAAARAHDMGHPPFGHIAERVLMERCDGEGIDGYEGNAQSFRIITKLAVGSGRHPGLNLTRRILRSVLKYPWLRAGPDVPEGQARMQGDYDTRKKWGAYATEQRDFEFAMEHGPPDRPSLEAQIMDLADDITYAVHDLEDFYRADLTPVARLQQDADERARFIAKATTALAKYERFDATAAADAFNDLMTNVIKMPRPYGGTNKDRLELHRASSVLISRFIDATSVEPPGIVQIRSPEWHEVNMLKQLTWQYVIASPDLATIQEGQKHIIRELFNTLSAWTQREMAEQSSERLPTRLRELARQPEADAEHLSEEPQQKYARAVADYIASLTEPQAVELYGRLHGISRASVLSGWVRMH